MHFLDDKSAGRSPSSQLSRNVLGKRQQPVLGAGVFVCVSGSGLLGVWKVTGRAEPGMASLASERDLGAPPPPHTKSCAWKPGISQGPCSHLLPALCHLCKTGSHWKTAPPTSVSQSSSSTSCLALSTKARPPNLPNGPPACRAALPSLTTPLWRDN